MSERQEDRKVLCGANAYEQKYYFNPEFSSLPQQIQDELHILCVLFTEEIGGIFTVEYNEDGELELRTEALEADAMYDDIGGALRIKQLQEEKRELFRSLELFYRLFFLGEDLDIDAETDGDREDKD
ncbi:MAG TPA: hypothetical protein IAB52_08255 [Candidatus Scatomonas merdavium]|nr:hypothetical protein [Candidatus Scatomonas merdavium]